MVGEGGMREWIGRCRIEWAAWLTVTDLRYTMKPHVHYHYVIVIAILLLRGLLSMNML